MEKKLLSTAVAAALVGSMGIAQADSTLYGNVNLSINNYDVDQGDSDTNMESNTSAIGVKGSEDLGNGLSAIYQAEFQFDAANGTTGNWTGRDQFVGLSTKKLGKVRFGTLSTTYKGYGATVDPLYRTSLEGRSHGLQSQLHRGKGENGQGRMTRHIRYDSPSWAGFGFSADYSLDENDPDASDDNTYGGGINYKNDGILDGLWLGAAYITSDQGGDDDAYKFGAKLNWGNFGLYGQYEHDGGLISGQLQGGNTDTAPLPDTTDGQNMWFAALSYTWGNTLLYGGYGEGDNANNSTNLANSGGVANLDSGFSSWTVAVDHKLSKRTDVYAGYNKLDCNNYVGSVCGGANLQGPNPPGTEDGSDDFFSVGLRHKF